MSTYFGYTRVSTVKQGDGVSLEAQRDAITNYAAKFSLSISHWFEEKETAAKQGRPKFNQMIAALQSGDAAGVVIHKIDRSARNFSDWAMIGELLDAGIDVRFAHESLDMTSRGGRLTADIQAVIAADYVRNLRQECIKGLEGRLKQGIYPFKAPIGYLDQGAGKAKIPDPQRAPFVRQAFELYATQQYSIRSLLRKLNAIGFRNSSGRPISKGCLEILLNNPFYHGTIFLKRTQRTFQGVHEPIIDKALFDRVQALKSNKQIKKETVHNHLYRRLITCGHCTRSLYGELHKGRVYMRCQTRGCATKSIRQDRLMSEFENALRSAQINDADHARLKRVMVRWLKKRSREQDKRAIELQLANLNERQEKLTDALLDALIDKATFEERKARLAADREALEKSLSEIGETDADERLGRHFLELTKSLSLLYQMADPQKKRRLTEILFSNRSLVGKNLCLTTRKWLSDKEWALGVLCGGPDPVRTRIKSEIGTALQELNITMREDSGT